MESQEYSNRVIPEGEQSCIWVDAGLLSYKLCDLGFDCEECELDRAIRKQHPAARKESQESKEKSSADLARTEEHPPLESVVGKYFADVGQLALPSDRHYYGNHLWAMRIDANTYRVGIDHYASHFIEPTCEFVTTVPGTSVSTNDPCAWLVLENLTVAMRTPMPGRISRTNKELAASPSYLRTDPYGRGWVCELNVQHGAATSKEFLSAAEMAAGSAKQFAELQSEIVRDLERDSSAIGTTLADGGATPKSLRDLLGARKFLQFLAKLFSTND